jgi:pimeloyl-ACP methyl ester carboxylesterase
MKQVRPYRITTPPEAVDDLRRRLAVTRWPPALTDNGWEAGTNSQYLQELVGYWAANFDWPARENTLNALSHFSTNIDDVRLHFVHVRGHGPNPLPIIITNGWPSTFAEMTPLIPLLVDPAAHGGAPEDSFDVIVPSLPGFAYSSTSRPRNPQGIAEIWARLMRDVLGYDHYVAHGSDIGASVTARLGVIDSTHVRAIHVTSVSGSAIIRHLGPDSAPLSAAEREFLADADAWYESEGAYAHVQRTKPDTLALALNDSPVGLASWIVEKLRQWSDCGGDVERRFTKDDILTIVSTYWFTQTIGSSMRTYYETRRAPWRLQPGERVEVPTGVAIFPADIANPPREWGARAFNVQRWTKMTRGGHFPAHEEPQLLAAELREFFRPFRTP